MDVLIVILVLLLMYNVIFYIPNKLKDNEEKTSLHFRELHLRLNRIEKMLEEKMDN